MTDRPIGRQFGLWDSPVTPASLARGLRLSDVQWGSGQSVVWLEGRSASGVLVVQEAGADAPRDLTGEVNVRAEVGYGGGDFAVHGEVVFFVAHREGRIYRQPLRTGSAEPITPAFGKAASMVLSPDGVWVAYVHHDEDGVDRLAIVDSEGKLWPQILESGRDFYMQPTWSPDGAWLSWVAWDHPLMPWDGSRLYIAPVRYQDHGAPRLGKAEIVAGGGETAVFQPEFTRDGRKLVFVSDETGWGHLWALDLRGGERRQLTDGEQEYLVPAWGQGMRTYALSPDSRFATCAASRLGFVVLERVDLQTGARQPVPELAEYTDASQLSSAPARDAVAFIGSASTIPPRVVVHDFTTGRSRTVARALGETVSTRDLARGEALEWKTVGGEIAHGILYPPTSSRFEGAGKPPVLVVVHGGPTGQVRAGWSSQAQFFATRGYAVLYVNYRGSTGYGREYMIRLRGNWGVCDVEDAVSGIDHLAREGRIDPERTVILGGSAGGFTVLQTLVTRPEAFAAGICLYGVSNQFSLAADTHKFEERYLDSLLGELPAASDVYRERSPVFHADRIRRPLAIFQGEVDRVVPRDQSDAIVEALKRSGTPHLYHVYEGEGHGWRKSETIEHFYCTVEKFLRDHVIFG